MREFPWLEAADFQAGRGSHPSSGRSRLGKSGVAPGAAHHEAGPAGGSDDDGDGGESSHGDASDVHEPEEVLDADELRIIRDEWEFEEGRVMSLYTRVMGGEWTMKHKKVVIDGVMATSRASAKDWCHRFDWPRSRSYYFSKYTRLGAHMVAEEFCRRSEHFLNLYLADGALEDDDFVYTQGHLESYEADLEFISWLCEQDIESPQFEAGSALQKLAPCVGG
jgi:hypothetical protein